MQDVGWAFHQQFLKEGERVLVLEFSNHTSNSIRLYANSGAAQILFFRRTARGFYADRNGKYQNQTGITLAKSK